MTNQEQLVKIKEAENLANNSWHQVKALASAFERLPLGLEKPRRAVLEEAIKILNEVLALGKDIFPIWTECVGAMTWDQDEDEYGAQAHQTQLVSNALGGYMIFVRNMIDKINTLQSGMR